MKIIIDYGKSNHCFVQVSHGRVDLDVPVNLWSITEQIKPLKGLERKLISTDGIGSITMEKEEPTVK